MFSFLSPTQIIDQLMERLQSALKTLIILFICSLMSCVTLAYLIDRFLNQLDAGEIALTRSMGLLLILLSGFILTLIMNFRSLRKKDVQMKSLQVTEKTESALETALAALVMSYVEERSEKLKEKVSDKI